MVQAPAGVHGDALVPVEEEALVTLAALEALVGALDAGREAGAGVVAGAGAELVVAVGRAGEGWRVKKKPKESSDFTICSLFSPFPRKKKKKKHFAEE